jgi:RND family efflux transporter MFP subunit
VYSSTLFALLLAPPAFGQGPGDSPPAPVIVDEVIQRQLNMGETFVGSVMPVRRSTVGSQVEGRVEEFSVNEGDRVAAGQPLARLRTTTVDLEMKAAQAELELREAELSELERSAPKEIEQAKARMDAAQAQVTFNEKRLKRFRDLYASRVVSDDEMEEQVYAEEAARKAYAEARSAWELARSGVWDAKIEQGKARVKIQQETINKLSDLVQQHTISAPFDGYVTQEHVEVGQWVAKGGPVVEMVEVDHVDVQVHVLERYEPELRVGSPARIEIEALRPRTWTGQVVLIVPQAEVRSRSFPVKVRLKNEPTGGDSGQSGLVLKPGMLARVTLPVGRRDSVTMVPKDALVLGKDSRVVWVVTRDRSTPDLATAAPLPVELGVSYDDLIEVRGALEPGQLVVVEGNERIRPGQKLAITKRSRPSAGPPRVPSAASRKVPAKPTGGRQSGPAPGK